MAEDEPKRKKLNPSILSDPITTEDFQSLFRTHWQTSTPLKTHTLEVITYPFRVGKISNFLKRIEFLEELKEELSDIETRRPETDLYSFEQTSDLANVDGEKIRQFHKQFKNDMRSWMSRNTGIELSTTMSMSSASYSDTDYLLCHDDNLGDRRIAFVLYLSKNWTAEDGGSLDLFDTDSSGLPRNIVRSLVPEYNSLVFFEVSDTSYHQVAEIISSDKSRCTINGWFHGPVKPSTRPPRPEIELTFHEPSQTAQDLGLWVMKAYLCEEMKQGIQKEVEKKSYTYLTHFLQEQAYNNISADIMSANIKWSRVGPADLRNYEVADEDTLPISLKEFYELFKSIEIFKLLKEYTELDLVPDGKSMKPTMVIELQRWSKGCYTLIYDKQGDEHVVINKEAHEAEEEEEVERHKKGMNSSGKVAKCRRGSSHSSDDSADEEERMMKQKNKKKAKPKCSTGDDFGEKRRTFSSDSDDSQGFDIGNDPSDLSEAAESADESGTEPGTLDVIMQFNTSRVPEDETIDYVDPKEQDGTFIHVPAQDNHLCLVYKTSDTCRVQKYVNHYCEGYFYNLICSYYE